MQRERIQGHAEGENTGICRRRDYMDLYILRQNTGTCRGREYKDIKRKRKCALYKDMPRNKIQEYAKGMHTLSYMQRKRILGQAMDIQNGRNKEYTEYVHIQCTTKSYKHLEGHFSLHRF